MKPVAVINNMFKGLKNNLKVYFLTVVFGCSYIAQAKNREPF